MAIPIRCPICGEMGKYKSKFRKWVCPNHHKYTQGRII